MKTKSIVNVILRGLLAGICISIGSIVYMNVRGVVGPVLFATGLMSIFTLDLYLYTGKVPYVKRIEELPFILTILLSNFVGCCITYLFPNPASIDIVNQKLSQPLLQLFVEAMLCNALIYIACEANKKGNTLLVIFAVATFILCGFEHSIANVCFFVCAGEFSMDAILNTLIVVVGNAFGGLITRRIHIGQNENKQNRNKLLE